LGGKPLIVWTIEAARVSTRVDRVLLSTEDDKIARIGRDAGAEVPFKRPVELAGDESSHPAVVLHALQWVKDHDGFSPEYVLVLQPTSPFRTAQDIDAAIDLAMQPPHPPAVVGVGDCVHHPYWVRRVLQDGTLQDFINVDLKDQRRQALPKAYVLNGAIFLVRVDSLVRTQTFIPPGARAYIMPPERSLDIDTPWDFHMAELLMRSPYRSSIS
jgi:CMP-N,N'-diacetyllegionaminic acid synthase